MPARRQPATPRKQQGQAAAQLLSGQHAHPPPHASAGQSPRKSPRKHAAGTPQPDPDDLDGEEGEEGDGSGSECDEMEAEDSSSEEEEGNRVEDDAMDLPPDRVISDPSGDTTSDAVPTTSAPDGTAAGGAAATDGGTAAQPAAKKKRVVRTVSVGDADFTAGKLLFNHTDIETCCPGVMIQLSGTMRYKNPADGQWLQVGDDFDEYVRPPMGTTWLAHEDANCHGLSAKDHRITSADPIETVWPKYVAWIEARVGPNPTVAPHGLPPIADGRGVIVAWNGKACDLEAMHKLVDFSGDLNWPAHCPYFFDPCSITYLIGSPWHKFCHVENHGASLEVTHQHAMKRDLAGAHNSIQDAKGQAVVSEQPDLESKPPGLCLMDMANKPFGLHLINDIFEAKRKRGSDVLKETTRPVPAVWVLDGAGSGKEHPSMQYDGAGGGAKSGPTSAAAAYAADHVGLFLTFLPEKMTSREEKGKNPGISLEYIAEQSNIYATETVKVGKYGLGRKKKNIFVPCAEGSPGARPRFTPHEGTQWNKFTGMSMLVFFALLIFAAFIEIRDVLWFWSEPNSPKNCGIHVAWVQNSMTQNAVAQVPPPVPSL